MQLSSTMQPLTQLQRVLIQFLQWIELPWVLLCGPVLLFPDTLAPLAWRQLLIPSLFVCWLLRLLLSGLRLEPWPMHLAIGILLLCFPMGLWLAVDQALAWATAGYIAFGIALYVALLSWPPCQHAPGLLLVGLLLAGLGATGLGIGALTPEMQNKLLIFLPPAVNQTTVLALFAKLQGISGTVNINIFASISAFLQPIYLALLLHRRRDLIGWLLPLWLGLGVGTTFLLFLTASRGSLLAAAVACVAVFLYRWPRLCYLLVLIPIFIAAFVFTFGYPVLIELIQSALSIGVLSGRQEIWYRALLAMDDFSFTGIGIGMFGTVIPVFYPYGLLQDVNFPHAHNLFFQVALDFGCLGLLAYGAIWVHTISALVQMRRYSHTAKERTYIVVALGCATSILTYGLLDIALWGTKLAFMPWLLLAFASALKITALQVSPRSKRRHETH